MNNVTESSVTIVEFPDGTREYYGSLAAIYEKHTPKEIGLVLGSLHHRNVGSEPYDTGKCRISKQVVYRLKQTKK